MKAAFMDFEIDLTKNPVGDLPTGVTQISYPQNGVSYNGSQHGWCWYAIEFAVDGPVKITLGGCQYINDGYTGYVTDGNGSKLGDIDNKTAACYDADPANNVGTFNYTGGAGTLRVFCGQYCPYIKVEKTETPNDQILSVDKTSTNVFVPSYMSSNSVSVTLTGSNLTDGTYQVTQPSVDGLTISPTSFTVADGAVNQAFTVSYSSSVAVASANADFTFATSDADKSVTVTATYGKTAKRNIEQATISEATTWDFAGVAAANIQLQGNTSPAYNEEFIYATLGEIKNDATFNAAALKVKGQWAYYQGNAQVNTIKFTTTVPGTVDVTFHPGTSANRTLYINGVTTGTSTSSAYVSGSATVTAGEVVISGKDDNGSDQTLRVSKIVFTPSKPEPAGDIILYDLKTSVGTAEVTAADATVTAGTSLVLSNTAGRIKITPKSGEKFKDGDKVEFSGSIGNTSKNYGLKIFAADGTTNAGQLYVAGTTSPLKVSGALTLATDADYIYIGRYDGTTTTMTDMTISRPGSTPDPTPTEFKDFEIDLTPENVVLPEGVTQISYPDHGAGYNGAQHGHTWFAIQFDAPAKAKITVEGCNYQNGYTAYLTDAAGTKIADIDNSACGGRVSYIYDGEPQTLKLYCGQYCPYIKVEEIKGDVKNWNPTWNATAKRWEVKMGETDEENGESLIEALKYLNVAANVEGKNKTLYLPNGTYDLGTTTQTAVKAGMHLIGESQDGVLIKNQPTEESINQTATLKIDGANVTLENMTIKCRAPYGTTTGGAASDAERGVCVQDCGNGTHYINVTLDGLQDTYYSNGANGMTATFDNCTVMGNVDFFCGNGNITVNESRLLIVSPHKVGGSPIICAPATYTEETQGYVFNNCIVDAAPSSRSANAFDCATAGHSTAIVDNNFYLARAWYAGGSATEGKDRTPRVTFNDPELNITPKDNWAGSIGYAQAEERREFTILSNQPDYSDEAKLIASTNKPFAFATATDRTDPNSVSSSNITGGGAYSIESALALLPDGWEYNNQYSSNGKKIFVLKSANTKDANQNIVRVPMEDAISSAIAQNDIILFDGNGGVDNEFVVAKSMSFKGSAQGGSCDNKTILGINGAKIATEWYMTAAYKNALENIQTSSGTGVNSASTASGTGGSFKYKNGTVITIGEEGEFLTRSTLYEMVEEKYYKKHGEYLNDEPYKHAGIFYFSGVQNLIFRNLVLQGPGSIDVGGEDLMSVINGAKHVWVDHCEFIDGIDGNFDITNHSDFVTVSWCRFSYTDRSYAHQNSNLVGSDDAKTEDRGTLNITFAYNEWGANCRARMPMARYGKIHMLNNYYNCAGNAEPSINPRKESEFLIEGNYFAKGVANIYKESSSTAVTWKSDNVIMDKSGTAGTSKGGTVTVPYQYSIIAAKSVPDIVTLNAGAVLGKSLVFDPDLMEVLKDDNGDEINPKLSDFQPGGTYEDGLVLSVWADNAHTFQWYKAEKDEDGNFGDFKKIDGATRNSLTYMPIKGETIQLYCKAFGVSGSATTKILTLTIDGETKPIYTLDLDDTNTYAVTSGSPQIFTVNAGDAVTYQWYKSANADGSSATEISGATGKSYTYDPTTAEVIYLFCRAHNTQGDTDSKIVKVKGTYRNVKFTMYATYDANAKESSVFVEGATSNINNAGTHDASITSDTDDCTAKVTNTNGVAVMKFTAGNTHFSPLGIYAEFTPTTAIAEGDKIELTVNTSNSGTGYGFYVCKAAELGDNNANVIGTVNAGSAFTTSTVDAPAGLTTLYLIPFVGATTKSVNLANVVVYGGNVTRPVDDPVFITDLEEEYKVKVGQRQTLSVEVDENDVQGYQWYKNSTKTAAVDEAHKIEGATSESYDYTAEAEGTEYLYCVVTGKKPGSSITSTVAAVIATAANDKDPIIWIFDDFGKDNYNATNGYAMVPYGTTTVVSVASGKELKFTCTANKESSASRVYTGLNETIGDNTIKSDFYLGGAGTLTNRFFVTDPLSGSGTLTIVYTSKSADCNVGIYDNANTATALATSAVTKSTAYNFKLKNLDNTRLRITHDAKARIGAIIWTPNQAVVLEKGIYSTTFSDWKTDKTATDNTSRTSNTTITQEIKTKSNETITFTLNNCAVDNSAYYKIKEQSGVTTPGCVVAMKSNDTYNGTITSTTFDNITKIRFVEAVSGTNRGMGLKVKGIKEDGTADADWVVISDAKVETGNAREVTVDVNRTNVQIQFYNLVSNQYGGLTDLVIYGMMELMNCEEPTYKETWSGDANEQWHYDFISTTETAHLKYTVDDEAEQTITSNKGRVSVDPGQKISIWAIDSEETLPNSPVVEVIAPAKKATTTPTLTVGVYDVANHNYPVTISGADDGAQVYYTLDGTEPSASSTLYSGPFTVGQGVTVKAIAIRDHYADSPVLTYTTATIDLPQKETFKTTGAGSSDDEAKSKDNILNSATIQGKYISGIDGKTGLKYTINGATDQVDADGTTKINGIQIDVHDGYVITELDFADFFCNTSGKNITLNRIFIDGVAIPGFEAKTIPNSPKSNFKIEGIAATLSIVLEIIPDDGVNQARAAISPVYEFNDVPAGVTITDSNNSEDVITLTSEDITTFKSSHVYTVNLEKMYAEDPIVKITTEKGYEYIVPAGLIETDGDKLTHFTKSFVGVEYTIKAKVNAVKSPNIEIASNLSLKGGYKVTLSYSNEDGVYPYIKIGDNEWEAYDAAKEYYALGTVQSKMKYGDNQSLETAPRTANCPANSYEPGKPFAVFVRQPSYLDSQDGAKPYNTPSPEETDKIYKALTAHYNVIDFCKPSGTEVLNEMPDIADAKLVVITEMISGSGSYVMDEKDTKSTALTMTLKRDVVDKTNVINFKMFTYSQSKNNTDRWAWAQPVTLPSNVVTITPVKPADGMYEVFGDAMVNRDGTITLWNTYDTDYLLNHLQPVFNFREADVDEEGNPTEELPVFTPLAYAYDPDNLDETYHILHYYDKTADGKTTTYVGFGLSVNEWTNYGDNIEAIVGKIAEMIANGRPLDSKLTGLPDPKVVDNGDGSAMIMNNNQNATTYYCAIDAQTPPDPDVVITPDFIKTRYQEIDENYNTLKYSKDQIVYAFSEYNGVYSNVVRGEIKGSCVRYIIRENEDKEAKGMMARYPFEVNEDGSAKTFDFPYNQSWSKDGYTVTSWIGADGNNYIPGTSCTTLTQDLKVTAIWTANKHKLTDLQDESKERRTVTWNFRQSEGAPALALESTAGKMQAIIVGQAKFQDGTWIDVPMTINTDHSEVLPDNGTSYHGKFNNSQNNYAPTLTVGENTYTGNDYAQVRTGTQFTFPTVAGSNIIYKQIDLVEADKTTGTANGNVCRSQISQSKLTDGTGTVYAVRNPGYKLDAEGKIVFADGKAQLATPSDLSQDLQNDIQTMENQGEYEYDKKGETYLGGNAAYGGLIFYNGEEKMATLTSIESAQYIEHADAAKKGTLNAGSVFMQSLSVTYPQLYDFDYELVPEESGLVGANEKAAEVTVVTPARANCDGRYSATQTLYVTVKPSYGYYVGADNEEYSFLKDGGSTFTVRSNEAIARYFELSADDAEARTEAETINADYPIPNDGAVIKLYLINRGKITISLLKRNTYKYKVEADPSTCGIVQYNTGNGRAHEDEYLEFPEGATMYMIAKPKMGYRFAKWRLNSASDDEGGVDLTETNKKDGTTIGDGVITNPFDPTDRLEKNELQFVVSAENSAPKYVAIFEPAEEGTAHYLFAQALLQKGDTYYHLELSPEEINAFPNEFTSTALNIPYYYTLYKEGYTLDHWVENKNGSGIVDLNDPGKTYKIGTFYYYDVKDEQRYLIPVFKENELSYDYRATSMDITWDFRSVQYAQRVTFTQEHKPASSPIYYSTHATFNGNITVDVPLKISIGDEGRFVNTIMDEWCEFGERTKIEIPSGLGATFTLATYAPITSTNFDGVVPTEYEVRKEEGINVYYYTYTTPSTSTSVTLTIDNDYSYYKSLRAQLPSADNVPLRVSVNNPDYGSIKLMKAESSTNEDITDHVKQTIVEEEVDGERYTKFTLGMGTAITIQADRQRLYVVDYYEDAYGNRCGLDAEGNFYAVDKDGNDITIYAQSKGYMVRKPTAADISAGYNKDPNNLIITTRIQTYDNKAKIYYKLNDLYQINYTSGREAEGEAPGVVLIEKGEGFEVPEANHYLYLDGYTLKYWVDEDGNKYDFGQTYTPGETFVNDTGKTLPSGLAAGGSFNVPAKDLFLSPHFEINEFTVLNLTETATAVWPLTREGKTGTTAEGGYAGNSGVIIYYQKSVGVYVTQLKLSDGRFIDLKLDINCASVGKVDNRTQGDRCQINGETVISIPSSGKCDLSLYTVNGKLSTTKIAGTKISSSPVYGSNEKGTLHYTGENSVVDIEFAGEAGYFYQIEGVYYPIETQTMPELDYVTVGNIALGAIGTPLAGKKLSTLKKSGKITDVEADLSASTTGVMPQVKAMATNDGYVEIAQATIDHPEATLLLKTEDGVTVAVYKIAFAVIPPIGDPLITDVKVSNHYQCDLDKLDDGGKEGTYYYGYKNGDGTTRTTSEYLVEIEDAGINGTIAMTFNKTMKAVTLEEEDFKAMGGKASLSQSITSPEGQTLVFSYWNLKVDTEYDFEIKANKLKDVYGNKYPHPIRLHFRTTATTTEINKQLFNFVVTHNQPSKINEAELKMEADGERLQVASDELIANLEALRVAGKIAGYGTLDEGIRMANEYDGKGRFYIFVPDGEYQLMGNTPLKMKYASGNFAPADENGKLHDEVLHASNGGRETQNGLTSVSRSNVSITGQSQTRTIVWNRPWVEGIEYTSTLHLNSGTTGFYAQDMTLKNSFDYATSISKQGSASAQAARAVALWDQSSKAIMKNVSLLSYQDTYYSKSSNPKTDDTRGYYEDCTFAGYVDFFCGDGDHWFERCNLILRPGKGTNAANMIASRQVEQQQWGYVYNNCSVIAEDGTNAMTLNDGKFTIARPWDNSPAISLLYTTFHVLPTDDGYKAMSKTGQLLRIHEFRSMYPNGTLIDLSARSLRNSSPGAGSYDAVMTPAEARKYEIHNVMGGTDGYDPTLYTRQRPAPAVSQDDQYLVWDEDPEALCYFVFRSLNETDTTSYQLYTIATDDYRKVRISDNNTKKYYYRVRAANQRGGLGWYSDPIKYKDLGYYDLKAKAINYTYGNDAETYEGYTWSTICLPFGASVPEGSWDEATETVNTEDQIRVFATTEYKDHQLKLELVQHLDSLRGYVVYARPDVTYRFFGSTHPSERETLLDGYAPEYVDVLNSNGKPTGEKQPSQVKLDRLQANVNCYTLSYKSAFGIGFYTYKGDYLNPYKAWLDAAWVVDDTGSSDDQSSPSSIHVRFVFDDFEMSDDIEVICDDRDHNSELIFDLQGHRIQRDQLRRGNIYIIGGKKVMY